MSIFAKNSFIGAQGEKAVGIWLQKQGYTLLAFNFTVRQGEVDIIATRDEILAFVEVKTRSSQQFALSEVITRSKQLKIIRAAKQFIRSNGPFEKSYRFDVALVDQSNQYAVDYIPHAFTESVNYGY